MFSYDELRFIGLICGIMSFVIFIYLAWSN